MPRMNLKPEPPTAFVGNLVGRKGAPGRKSGAARNASLRNKGVKLGEDPNEVAARKVAERRKRQSEPPFEAEPFDWPDPDLDF